jgi:hypothetical protein
MIMTKTDLIYEKACEVWDALHWSGNRVDLRVETR